MTKTFNNIGYAFPSKHTSVMGFSNCFVRRLSLGCFSDPDKNNFSRASTLPTYKKLPFPT
jgi:hypothetical protein